MMVLACLPSDVFMALPYWGGPSVGGEVAPHNVLSCVLSQCWKMGEGRSDPEYSLCAHTLPWVSRI